MSENQAKIAVTVFILIAFVVSAIALGIQASGIYVTNVPSNGSLIKGGTIKGTLSLSNNPMVNVYAVQSVSQKTNSLTSMAQTIQNLSITDDIKVQTLSTSNLMAGDTLVVDSLSFGGVKMPAVLGNPGDYLTALADPTQLGFQKPPDNQWVIGPVGGTVSGSVAVFNDTVDVTGNMVTISSDGDLDNILSINDANVSTMISNGLNAYPRAGDTNLSLKNEDNETVTLTSTTIVSNSSQGFGIRQVGQGNDNSGNISLYTGVTGTSSGDMSLLSGGGSFSGNIVMNTGGGSTDSGELQITSGSGNTKSGDVTLTTGSAIDSAGSGDVFIASGNGTTSGDITISTAAGSTTNGDIALEAPQILVSSGAGITYFNTPEWGIVASSVTVTGTGTFTLPQAPLQMVTPIPGVLVEFADTEVGSFNNAIVTLVNVSTTVNLVVAAAVLRQNTNLIIPPQKAGTFAYLQNLETIDRDWFVL